jgi:hypothetical protein
MSDPCAPRRFATDTAHRDTVDGRALVLGNSVLIGSAAVPVAALSATAF